MQVRPGTSASPLRSNTLGLKATQVDLIAEIARLSSSDREPGPSLQDLATQLAIQISAVTHAIKPLVRDGLVQLRQDVNDRRTKHGVLTALEKKPLKEALVLWADANSRVETLLGSSSAATLRKFADKVASDEFLAAYKLRHEKELTENPEQVISAQ